LNNPDIAKLFDSDNDGKADFLGCEKICGCASVIKHQLDAFKLRNTITHHQNDYSNGVVDLISRFQEGKSVFYYTWTPYWLSSILKPNDDVIWLELPYSAYPNGSDTTLSNGKNYGFKVNNIHIISLKTFTLQNPAAAKLFKTAGLSISEVGSQDKRIHDGENTPEDIQGHANEWITKIQYI
jgi:glycine betaine/proline transport system substrate-binding protein